MGTSTEKKPKNFSWRSLKLRGRLIAGYVFLFICLLGYAIYFARDIHQVAKDQALHEASDAAALIAITLTRQSPLSNQPPLFDRPAELQEFIASLKNLEYRDIEVIDAERRIIADVVEKDIGTILQTQFQHQIDNILQRGSTFETFSEESAGHPDGLMLIAVPLEKKGAMIGVLILDYSTALQISKAIAEGRIKLLWLALLIPAVLIFIVYFMVSRTVIQPIGALTAAAHRIGAGELDQPIQHRLNDEIGELSDAFETMRLRLKDSIDTLGSEVNNRIKAESQLRANRDALEKLVEVRTKDLEEARDVAVQASQTKSEFIANISHEIRTPLTPIIGFAESIIQDNPDAETRNALLNSIIRNGRHLFNVINEILDLSKIEANKLEIEKIDVDVSQLFHDIESVIGTMAREKGMEFRKAFLGPVPRRIISDPTRIKQILMNLLTNSIKFTDAGHIGLYLEFEPRHGRLHFIVSDTGIGVPQDKLERLFKSFSQADSSISRRYGGTGLGLHISQRLARLLGGDITVQSVQNVGTKFNVTIAAEGAHLHDLISAPDSAVPLSYSSTEFPTSIPQLSGHILLAEDSPDIQRLISHYITKTGATVSTANNGQIALEMAMSNDYDLILMDMQMPLMGGEETVEMLRSCGCETPIVALTANAMKGDREKYTSIGCNDFLGKPIKQSAFYYVLVKNLPASNNRQANIKSPEQDEEFLALQSGFLESLPGYLDRLREAIAQKNYPELSEQAHMLKGMGGSFGFAEITEHAATL